MNEQTERINGLQTIYNPQWFRDELLELSKRLDALEAAQAQAVPPADPPCEQAKSDGVPEWVQLIESPGWPKIGNQWMFISQLRDTATEWLGLEKGIHIKTEGKCWRWERHFDGCTYPTRDEAIRAALAWAIGGAK